MTECKMRIQFKDQTPVQKIYYSMPKALHLEIKHFTEDLLNKGCIRKSTSHYSHRLLRSEKKMEAFHCVTITSL